MGPRAVIQSYKKVLNFAPSSKGAGNTFDLMAVGVDSIAAGQTGPTDANVPTGCVLKYIEIQTCLANLAAGAVFFHFIIQRTHAGQGALGGNGVGGTAQRNQVFFQKMVVIGFNQNGNFTFRFKIPRKFQRVREGDTWSFGTTSGGTHTSGTQIIYKFYR